MCVKTIGEEAVLLGALLQRKTAMPDDGICVLLKTEPLTELRGPNERLKIY